MVNNSKVKLMTRLAIFEKKHPKDLKLGKYYKGDYIKFNLLKTFLAVTGGYILCLGMAGFYNIEYFIQKAVKLDYKSYGLKILGVYIILIIIFGMTNMLVSSETFLLSRKRLNKYYKKLKVLGKMYQDESDK